MSHSEDAPFDDDDDDDEDWVFVAEGTLDPLDDRQIDGSWMMLEGIDTPEEVEKMKQAAIRAGRARRAAKRLL